MVNLIQFRDAIFFHRVMGLCCTNGKRSGNTFPMCEINLAYENVSYAYSIFFRKKRTHVTYSILAYARAYPRALLSCFSQLCYVSVKF